MHHESDATLEITRATQARKKTVNVKMIPDYIDLEYLNKEHCGYVDVILTDKKNNSDFGFIKLNVTDIVKVEHKKLLQSIKLFFKPTSFYTKITKLRKFDVVVFKWTLDRFKRHIAVDIRLIGEDELRYDGYGRVFKVPSGKETMSSNGGIISRPCQHDCSICFNPCTIGYRSLPCTHHFHNICIFDWFSKGSLTTHNYCPVCRQQFTTARPHANRISLIKNQLSRYSNKQFHHLAVLYSMLLLEDSLLSCDPTADIDYIFIIKDEITIERWTKVTYLSSKISDDARAEMAMISKLRDEVADDLEHTHHNYASHLSRMLSDDKREEQQSKGGGGGIVVHYIGNEWNELLNSLSKLFECLNALCITARLSSRCINQYRFYDTN